MGNADGGSEEMVKKHVRKNRHLYLWILRKKEGGEVCHTVEGLLLHREGVVLLLYQNGVKGKGVG